MSNEKRYEMYGQRLSEARKRAGLMQKDVAKFLGVKDNIVSYYENGDRIPSVEQYTKLAKFLGVSADYLLGLSDAQTSDKDLQFVCDYTGLSDKTISAIQEYTMYDSKDEERGLFEQYNALQSKENRRLINDFILSDAFDCIIFNCDRIQQINKDVKSYLAIYFGDYDYFYKLNYVEEDKENVIVDIIRYLNQYKNENIHYALNDKVDLFSFQIQKGIMNYIEKSSILNHFDGGETQVAFDYLRYIVYESVESVYKKKSNIEKTRGRIKEYLDETNQSDIKKIQEEMKKYPIETHQAGFLNLKNLYDNLKQGDTNADNNKA